jgi:type II secretory pathway pseudopilin PulG
LISRTQRAISLIEYLVVLVAIAVLAAVAALMYGGDAQKARLARATLDVQALGEAQLSVARDHGVFVPLQTLDNSASAEPFQRPELLDLMANEPEALRVIDPSRPAADQVGGQASLVKRIMDWKGPYLEPKRVHVGLNMPLDQLDAATIRRDYPLDPWGQPYRFYSPIGLIGTYAASIDPLAWDSDNFAEDDRVDAYAIVSFGPDGQSDSISNNDDDVIYLISTPSGETAQ